MRFRIRFFVVVVTIRVVGNAVPDPVFCSCSYNQGCWKCGSGSGFLQLQLQLGLREMRIRILAIFSGPDSYECNEKRRIQSLLSQKKNRLVFKHSKKILGSVSLQNDKQLIVPFVARSLFLQLIVPFLTRSLFLQLIVPFVARSLFL